MEQFGAIRLMAKNLTNGLRKLMKQRNKVKQLLCCFQHEQIQDGFMSTSMAKQKSVSLKGGLNLEEVKTLPHFQVW